MPHQRDGFFVKWVDVSIVSHSQGALVVDALNALALSSGSHANGLRVWVTVNIPEPLLARQLNNGHWPFELRVIENTCAIGFGANHSQAFSHSQVLGGSKWFYIMNPDVLWPTDASGFWGALANDAFRPSVGLICPKQTDEHGRAQDYVRNLPTPWGLWGRMVLRTLGRTAVAQPMQLDQADWANGACMVWRSDVFAALGGFDKRYFMYCEDTDICLRMRLAGYKMEQGNATVVHLAQRNTGKSWRHLAWHVSSLLKLWMSTAFWRYVWRFKVGFIKSNQSKV